MAASGSTKTSVRVRMVLAAAVAVIGLGGAARAQPGPGPVDLSVVDRDTGQVLPMWRHHGRLFVAGEPGSRYGLRVTNNTDGRVLVVMSVDGVNILTGATASYDQIGYVFAAHQSYDVTGWRKSNTEVAAFTFAPLPQSYAARTGRPEDVGVIGVAVFKEKTYVPPPEPEASADRWGDSGRRYSGPVPAPPPAAPAPTSTPAAPPPSASGVVSEMVVAAQHREAAAKTNAPAVSAFASAQRDAAGAAERQDEKLGTGHGVREWSVVYNVDFQRATPRPAFVRQIEYDTYARLVEAGVIRAETPEHHPRPFPESPDGQRYVPDPPG